MAFARLAEQRAGPHASHGLQAGSFWQRSATALRPHWRDGRSRAPFVNAYKPSELTTDTVRLIPGKYTLTIARGEDPHVRVIPIASEYWVCTTHFDQWTKESCTCSAGHFLHHRDQRLPCRGCELHWATLEPDGKGRYTSRVSMRDVFAFSMLDYGLYHLLPQFRVDGSPKIHARTRRQYVNWTKCLGPGCTACNDPSISHQVGCATHWSMSRTQFRALREIARTLGQTCATCGARDALRTRAWVCSKCGAPGIVMAHSNMAPDALAAVLEDPWACERCKHEDFLDEVLDCASCARRRGLPRRVGLFDVDLNVHRVPGTSNVSVVPSTPAPVPQQFAALVVPKDLARIFRPTPLVEQERRFQWWGDGSQAMPPVPGQ